MTLKKRHGKCGSYTHNDGSLFIGDFDENGVKSGMGHLELPNGATYDGQFQKVIEGMKVRPKAQLGALLVLICNPSDSRDHNA